MYNKLVNAKMKVDNSWSQIDVQLQRRFDLIPNFVETVKAYASHESEIIKSHLYNFKTGEQIFIDLSDTLDEPLTNRELEVLRLMKQGLLSKEIANTLKVSINTVNTHRQNILQKLKANNSIEAVNFAQRLGLFNK